MTKNQFSTRLQLMGWKEESFSTFLCLSNDKENIHIELNSLGILDPSKEDYIDNDKDNNFLIKCNDKIFKYKGTYTDVFKKLVALCSLNNES